MRTQRRTRVTRTRVDFFLSVNFSAALRSVVHDVGADIIFIYLSYRVQWLKCENVDDGYLVQCTGLPFESPAVSACRVSQSETRAKVSSKH